MSSQKPEKFAAFGHEHRHSYRHQHPSLESLFIYSERWDIIQRSENVSAARCFSNNILYFSLHYLILRVNEAFVANNGSLNSNSELNAKSFSFF